MVDIGIQQGIRVNAINPGLIATDRFTRNVERVLHENSLHRDQALALLLSSHGTTRVGVPGKSDAYLSSVKADFIQAATIDRWRRDSVTIDRAMR
jgi:NAD(P)-dependent dehydrogenase (short-subunit alcohol dehydrogenase family)